MAQALYVIDDSGEATGRVYHFCSEWCREQFASCTDEPVNAGESNDWIDGTVCDFCEQPLA